MGRGLFGLGSARKGSTVDVAFDETGELVVVERFRGGKVRVLKQATRAAEDGNAAMVQQHFLREGAAVSSRVRKMFS